ncbi:hypothetical protein [Massilibacterium senegalense]|uniref:hypothetical protein n=1 Tax=Massilibacterium senegalense TaxID=1632858 RepID=UPI000783D477|nr:hypothetical protein [Massilibacterium senegalense]
MKNKFGLILLILFTIGSLVSYSFLPDFVVTQHDFQGNPTTELPKYLHLLISIVVITFLYLLSETFLRSISTKNKKYISILWNGIILFIIAVDVIIGLNAIGIPITNRAFFVLLGLFFIFLGFIAPKTPNIPGFQIDIPDEAMTKKLEKWTASLFVFGGSLIIIFAVLLPKAWLDYAMLIIILGIVLLLVIPSLIVSVRSVMK